MSDDLETVEDTANCSRAEVADDSCRVDFIEIVPLDRPSDDCEIPEVIPPLFEIKPEDLEEIKRDLDEEHDNVDSHLMETVDTPASDDHTAEVINPIVVLPPEDLKELILEQEPADNENNTGLPLVPQCYLKQEMAETEYESESQHFTTQVFNLFLTT